MGKKSLVLGAAIGYVLGARAGRGRYDQIAQQASKLWGNPKVQSTVGSAQKTVVDTAKSQGGALKEAAASSSVGKTVKDKLPGSSSSSSSSSSSTPSSPATPTPTSAGSTGGGAPSSTASGTNPPLNTPPSTTSATTPGNFTPRPPV